MFLEFTELLLKHAATQGLGIVFVADFNIDLLSHDTYACEFLDAIHSYGGENTVHQPTRVTRDTESLLDSCITNFNRSDSSSDVMSSR